MINSPCLSKVGQIVVGLAQWLGSGHHIPRETETQTTYGPQTWQRGLYAQWSIQIRAVTTRGGSQVLSAKSTFFSLKRHKGENLLCFLFSDPSHNFRSYQKRKYTLF